MLFGLIDMDSESRERRRKEREERRVKRLLGRRPDFVLKGESTRSGPVIGSRCRECETRLRPGPVVGYRCRECETRFRPEPTEEDKRLAKMFIDLKRKQRQDQESLAAARSAATTSVEVAPQPTIRPTVGRREYRSQNLLYG